jgi:hypothetical protein
VWTARTPPAGDLRPFWGLLQRLRFRPGTEEPGL